MKDVLKKVFFDIKPLSKEDAIFHLAQSSVFFDEGGDEAEPFYLRINFCDEETGNIHLINEETGDEHEINVSDISDKAIFTVGVPVTVKDLEAIL